MTDSWIKNPNGTTLARITTDSNDNQRIYNHNGQYLGWYNARNNITYNANGATFCSGNGLVALVK